MLSSLVPLAIAASVLVAPFTAPNPVPSTVAHPPPQTPPRWVG
jgi:hypothetical protein